MGDVVTTINLAPLVNSVNRVAAATARIEDELENTNSRLNQVSGEIRTLNRELTELKTAFDRFMDESKRSATLQKAATELIRVRQEIEQNFGGYKIVRETMLGVLQATDLALVKKTTISQVTEELMLSTPDYWLAPCLVAVAAWIGNDRDLANRAIQEAVKRDEEKTALTMALICRRNNRTDTCFEWLSLYFSKQSADNFTESNFTYLNAYLNGVFGPDSKHVCEDYIGKWMREIQGHGEAFEQEQTELWRNYCADFTVDLDGQFPQMENSVQEYDNILEYVRRINSVDSISGNFSKIQNVAVDEEKLKKDIDQTLVTLISRCDDKEEPLRKEEKYLQAIRYFDGNTDAAKQSILTADRKRTEDTIDLVGQMTNIIINRTDANPSERKTSVNFLSSYIRSGFHKYISETKANFPKQITLNVDGWSGTTEDGTNAEALHRSYEMHMQKRRAEDVAAATPAKPKRLPLGLAIPLSFTGIFALIYWPFVLISTRKYKEQLKRMEAVKQSYVSKIAAGHKKIAGILAEWKQAQAIVDQFESGEFPDIVA